jgi:hypothetical protein
MGFGDKFKDLAKQAQDAVAERKEQITDAVDRASVVADQRTHGKYTDKIAKVGQKAERVVEKLGSSDQDAASEPPAAGRESATNADQSSFGQAAPAEPPSVATEPPAFD